MVEAQHGRAVAHFDESFARLSSNTLSGRIGREQLGMLGLDLLELAHHGVVLGVADFRLVQHVIQMFVMTQRLAQFFDFLFQVRRPHVYYN